MTDARESSVTLSAGGGMSFVGPDATRLAAAIVLRASIRLWCRTKIVPTRGVTITKMLKSARMFTGKTYKISQAETAMDDLGQWIEAMKAALPTIDDTKKGSMQA